MLRKVTGLEPLGQIVARTKLGGGGPELNIKDPSICWPHLLHYNCACLVVCIVQYSTE
jgi:hypothetical protein